MVQAKIQDPCEPRRGILRRQEDKLPSITDLVGDRFDTVGKIIDINNLKTDIIADAIEDSRIDFEYTRDGKGELRKTKEFSLENGTQCEDSIYNYLSPKDSENTDVKIIY